MKVEAIWNSSFDQIVAGVAVFKAPSDSSNGPLILLVKRAPAEKLFPNNFELPGGRVEGTDLSIWDAVARELKEEMGIQLYDVRTIATQLPGFHYTTKKVVEDHETTTRMVQLIFAVVLNGQDDKVQTNPEEHSDYTWTDANGVQDLAMTEEALVWASKSLSSV